MEENTLTVIVQGTEVEVLRFYDHDTESNAIELPGIIETDGLPFTIVQDYSGEWFHIDTDDHSITRNRNWRELIQTILGKEEGQIG